MIDKKIVKNGLNDRLKEIDDLVDNFVPNDSINDLIKLYSKELTDYEYIDSVELFSTLKTKGSIKYINRYDKKLRSGGLLIKIYQNQKNGLWIGVIKQFCGKKYYIKFNSNYIFYLENKSDILYDISKCFLTNFEKGLYEII